VLTEEGGVSMAPWPAQSQHADTTGLRTRPFCAFRPPSCYPNPRDAWSSRAMHLASLPYAQWRPRSHDANLAARSVIADASCVCSQWRGRYGVHGLLPDADRTAGGYFC
jgi:hypothetical protein